MRKHALLILLLACGCRSRALGGPIGSGGFGYTGDMTSPARPIQEGGPPRDDIGIPDLDGGARTYGLLLFGGYWPHGALNDTWSWDGSNWSPSGSRKPPAAVSASAANIAGGVLLLDGDQTWIWRGDWTQLAIAGPPARWRAAMARLGTSVVLYGGEAISNPVTGVFHDAWQWDGSSWTQITAPPLANSDMGSWTCTAMASLGNEVIVPGIPTWSYDGKQWTQASALGPLPSRQCVAAQLQGNKVVVYTTPTDCTASPQTWVWDGRSWTQLAIFSPGYRTDTAMTTEPDGNVLLFGGADCGGAFLGDTWRFDGTSWTGLEVDPPPARYGAAMAAF
jgi:hypothetical protein